jgi:hypothetical protein
MRYDSEFFTQQNEVGTEYDSEFFTPEEEDRIDEEAYAFAHEVDGPPLTEEELEEIVMGTDLDFYRGEDSYLDSYWEGLNEGFYGE